MCSKDIKNYYSNLFSSAIILDSVKLCEFEIWCNLSSPLIRTNK